MSDISKIKLPSGEQYGIKDTIARNAIASHTHPIDSSLSTTSNNPVQNSIITNALNNKADIDHTHDLESLGIAYAECNNTEQIIQIKTLKDNNIEHTFSNNDVIIVSNDNINISGSLNIDNTGKKPIYYNNEVITNSDELIIYDRYNIDKSDTKSIFIYDKVNHRYNLITTNRYATNNKLLNNHYGFCTTSELLDNKCIIIDNYYNINTNDVIIIKFAYNVNNNATLNINNTGNKPIYYKNTAIINGMINSGDTAIFMYDEVNDRYNLITTDDYLNENLNNYYTEYYKYQDNNYRYWSTLIPDNYILENGDVIIIVFNNNIISNAKLNINNTGAKPLYYRGFPITDGIIKTGDTCHIYYNEINNVYELLRIPSGSNRDTVRNGSSVISVYSSSITSLSIMPYDNNQNLLDGNIFFTNINISGDGKISNCTLNINNTGDKPIYYKGFPITDNVNINKKQIFRYDIVNDRYDFLTSIHTTTTNFVYENQHFAVDYNNIIKNNVNINDYISKNNSILSIKFNNDIITGSYLNINDSKNKIISNSNNNFIYSIMIKAGDIVTFLYNNDVYNIISNNRNSTEYIYTYCQTSESESNKIISINNYNLKIGDIIYVYFYESVNANSTININNTGAKPIKFANKINARDVAAFLYDGDKYNLISIIDSKQKNIYCICNTAQSQNNKSISINETLYNLSDGSIVSIKFTNAVNANSTININNIGDYPIYYKGSAITDDVIKAGNIVTFIYQNKYFYLVSINSFNNAQQGFGYGICNSMVSDIYKYSVNINNYNNLTDHDILIIKFKNNVITNATLNINNTSDKPIYYNDSPIIDDVINAEEFAIFKYDETNDRYNLLITNNYTREKFNNVYYFSSIYLGSNMFASSSDNHTPIDKDIIILEFANISWSASGANSIININNSGNKPIYRNGEPIDDIIISGNTYAFEYDETNDRYNYLASLTSNNENYGESNSGGLIVPIDNYNIESGGIVSVKFNNNIDDANATLNINYKGAKPIYYNGSTITDDIIKAGDIATFIYDGTNYNLISLDRDFNIINESMGFGYGTCSTAASTIAKTVSMYGYELTKGGIVSIKFYNNVLSGATLNINNKGAKPIYHDDSTIIDNSIIKAGDIATFIYDGNGYYLIARGNITNENMGFGYGVCSTAASTIDKTVSIINYKLTESGIVSIYFVNAVNANSKLKINNYSSVSMYYKNNVIGNNIIKAGDRATFIYYNGGYNLISLDRDFNSITIDSSLSTTSNNPVRNSVITNALNNKADIDHTHTIDTELSTTSTNPVQNKIITNALNNKADSTHTHDIDTELSTTSTNPVQNSVITNALNNKADANHTHTDATASSGGLMSATDKANIDNFAANFKNKLSIANGIATLDSNGRVPSTQLPSYVDDIIEGYLYNNTLYEEDTYTTEIIGETGKIYVDLSTNKTYRWGGSNYIEISESLALGETSSTAYRGDYGKIAYEHAQSTNNPHNVIPSVYGYCYTERMLETKIVTINDFKLIPGMIIFIRFTYGVRYQAYLNISNTGAKPIYYKGKINDLCVTENGNNDIIQAGDIVTFIYDAANNRYNLISTNIIGNQRMGSGDAYCDTAASVNEKSVSIKEYVPFEGGIVSIYFVNAVNANSKLKINNYSSVYMYYKNNIIGNNIIKAGDRATFMYISSGYYLISLDRDFNDPITIDSSLSTTSTNPVRNSVITSALNNYIPTIIGTQIESTNNWTGNAQFETLEDGQRILYYLPYNSSGYDVVLNLTLSDGTTQTGNINCYLSGSTRLKSQYEAGNFIPLIYKENITFSGSSTTYTGWWAYSDRDIDNNTYLQISKNKLKAGSNGIHGNQLVMQTGTDTWESLTTSYTTATTKTKNSKGFYLGKILYHNNGDIVTSGNYTGVWRIMEQHSSINFSYSSNCGSTLVADKPVYLVGTINNGLFYLADTWWSQELPTTDDGKIYIYIGISYDTNLISKFAYNPIFWYNNGCVELYNGNGIKNINSNTTKAYLLGTTTNSADSGKQIYDNNVYLDTTAGELNTKSLKLNEKVTLNYNTNNNCIDFTFS